MYQGVPKPPPPSCAEGARLRSELASAWAENYRLRSDATAARITHAGSTADAESKAMKRKLDCLEAVCIAALIVAAAAASACIKWLVS